MINRLINLFRSRAFKKSDFRFNGKIPSDLPAIFIFPEDKTPFVAALPLYFSLKNYHKKIAALGIPDISPAFKYHFPTDEFVEYNPQKPESFVRFKDSVIYLGSIFRDSFHNFPEICRGRFSVAYMGFSSHYNFLVDTDFDSYSSFVSNFLRILTIPDLTEEFKKKLHLPPKSRGDRVFLDFKNPSKLKKRYLDQVRNKGFSTFRYQELEFIGDLPFDKQLEILSSSCCLVSDDSLFTGYALHYGIPVYSENCSKYYKNQLCKELREFVR